MIFWPFVIGDEMEVSVREFHSILTIVCTGLFVVLGLWELYDRLGYLATRQVETAEAVASEPAEPESRPAVEHRPSSEEMEEEILKRTPYRDHLRHGTITNFHSYGEAVGHPTGKLGAMTYILDSSRGTAISQGYHELTRGPRGYIVGRTGAMSHLIDSESFEQLTECGFHEFVEGDDNILYGMVGSERYVVITSYGKVNYECPYSW